MAMVNIEQILVEHLWTAQVLHGPLGYVTHPQGILFIGIAFEKIVLKMRAVYFWEIALLASNLSLLSDIVCTDPIKS